jgi:tRNA(fMet)-specific endonuclease VapC
MNGKYLLDTNIVVGLFTHDVGIAAQFATAPEVFVSVTVLGELYYGAQKSARVDDNLERLHQFLDEVVVIENDIATAYQYGLIRNELRVKGQPIPENDMWIAAAARQHDLALVSRDVHFAHVDGLKRESW